MADKNHDSESIGKVYALALINTATKQNVLPEVVEDVHALQSLITGNPQLTQFLGAVTVPDDEKIKTLTKIFQGKIHDLVLHTLSAMARRGRLVYAFGFMRTFDVILESIAGKVDVQLTLATELPQESLDRIKNAVAGALGKDPKMLTRTDSRLIGGLQLKIEDTLIDGSLATQLSKLNKQLKREGMTKLQSQTNKIVSV